MGTSVPFLLRCCIAPSAPGADLSVRLSYEGSGRGTLDSAHEVFEFLGIVDDIGEERKGDGGVVSDELQWDPFRPRGRVTLPQCPHDADFDFAPSTVGLNTPQKGEIVKAIEQLEKRGESKFFGLLR